MTPRATEQSTDELSRVQTAQTLAGLYSAARADFAAERWDAAGSKLEQLAAMTPAYRDAAALRRRAQENLHMERWLAGWYYYGAAVLRRGDSAKAVEAFRQVVGQRPDYRDAACQLATALAALERQQELSAGLASAHADLPAGRVRVVVARLEPLAQRALACIDVRRRLVQAYAPPTQLESTAPLSAGGSDPSDPAALSCLPPPERLDSASPEASEESWPQAAIARAPGRPPTEPKPAGTLAVHRAESRWARFALAAGVLAMAALMSFQYIAAGSGRGGDYEFDTPPVVAVATASNRQVATPPVAAVAAADGSAAATVVVSAADLFTVCQSAVAAATWDGAVTACEQVREKDASYPGLADALALSYVGLGKERLAQGGSPAAALEAFDRALAARPGDAEADQQRRWARAYQQGEAALVAGSWPAATDKLEQVYAAEPDYLERASDDGVKHKLYTARWSWGQALLEAGEYAEAQKRCEQALALVADGAEAAACQAAARAALATPTPRPATPVQPAPVRAALATPTPRPAAPVRPQAQPQRQLQQPQPQPQETQPPQRQQTPVPPAQTRAPRPST